MARRFDTGSAQNMPDLTGWSASDVLRLLGQMVGLNVKTKNVIGCRKTEYCSW